MIVISIISGALILGLSLAEQTLAMEENIIQHHIVVANVASQSIEAGYFVQIWPFETLKEISECESVLFWWVVKPDGEILRADDTAMWGKQITDESLSTSKTIVKDSVSPKTGETIKLIVHPLDIGEEGEQWTFYLGISLESVVDARNKMIVDGVGFFIVILIVIIFISFYFTRTVTRPITTLTEGAKAISQGDLDYNIKIKTEDEIGKLADAFNKMTKDLKKSRSELENYSKDLEKEVEERTRELNEKITELKQGEAATLSILEDMHITYEGLITSQKRIKLQNIKLKKLDRIKSDFLNVTSHELRTPMSAIKGYIQMVMKQTLGGITEEQEKALNIVLRNTDRLDHLIQDILDISRLESGTMKFIPEKTDIKRMVEETVETMQSSADLKHITINAEVEDMMPELTIDQERVKQVIINITSNAIKFSPDGSIINIRAKKDKNNILFEVQDFGRGIPENKQKKIFETFYQVDSGMDRKFGGAGLGLAISRGIILTHGGQIWTDSIVEKGSTFYFTLPIRSVINLEEKFKGIDIFGLGTGGI